MNMDDERLSGALQENILTVLCFDDDACKLVRGAITPQLFESSVFREVAGHAIDFIDQYGKAIKEHLPDHLEGVLKGDDRRKAETYERLLDNLHAARDTVNREYVLTSLHKFVRLQGFKAGLVDAVERVQQGDLSGAEVAMQRALERQVVAFSPGLDLSDAKAVGSIFDRPEEEGFTLGIEELDRRGIYPRRKELYSFVAPRKRGKSWFITHCAKRALMQRWSVLIVTLEMGEAAYGARMLQSFFSITRRAGQTMVTKLRRGRDGSLDDVVQERVERMSMDDPATRAKLVSRAKREFGRRKTFKIKGFPMHSLTMSELEAYLDGLERYEGFTPDLICVDYPRLMKHDAKNLRIELGQTIAGIRGIAGRRNCATVIVHQGNRSTENAQVVTAQDAEEDISLVAASDVVLTFSQTAAEKKLGLARLWAEYVRNSESQAMVLITQAYALGQFCLDSAPLGDGYWQMVGSKAGGRRADDRRRDEEDDDGRHD